MFNSQKLKTGATCPRAGGGEAVQGGEGDWGQREDALDALRGKRGVVEALVGGTMGDQTLTRARTVKSVSLATIFSRTSLIKKVIFSN